MVLAIMVDRVDATSPMVITHLLPKMLLSLNPNRIVMPAQSITSGAPTGVSLSVS